MQPERVLTPEETPAERRTFFPKHEVRVLLLEGLHEVAVDAFKNQTFQVESLSKSLTTDQLKEKIANVHILGIRSKTTVTKEILDCAKKLKAIGCFCIGTDQVDLDEAQIKGIPVFNSPFANSRSVAELVLGEVIMLARKVTDASRGMHNGNWNKTASGCYEIRGKTIGIIGYGHVGSQVSLLAESFNMNVLYYDIESKLPLGNAKECDNLEEVLKKSDFVTLHVPKTDLTEKMIAKPQLDLMKKGSYLLNLSRGSVVDLNDLRDALTSGHIAGCAVDVYPKEPSANGDGFVVPLQNCPNTILTPHIGGSTLEAQEAIGKEVSTKLIKYLNEGSTSGAVNFPQITMTNEFKGGHRLLNVHQNRPGVLKIINNILSDYNISAQWLNTTNKIGYLIVQVDTVMSRDLLRNIKALDSSIQTRLLY
ncbi:2-oxoglutarate reductase [Acrasis kona]|uniref:phosphoglycerate dehydrogenase n=1 Tax=Acrasis kona TaxID=1008807 RepID=A0AAW2ZKY3_9EUKA